MKLSQFDANDHYRELLNEKQKYIDALEAYTYKIYRDLQIEQEFCDNYEQRQKIMDTIKHLGKAMSFPKT